MAETDDPTLAALRQALRLIVQLMTDLTATQVALEARGLLTAAEVQVQREALEPRSRDVLQRIDQARRDTILDMLQRFEGPPQ